MEQIVQVTKKDGANEKNEDNKKGTTALERAKNKSRRDRIEIWPLGWNLRSSAVDGSWGREHVLPWVPEISAYSALPLG